MCTFLCIGSVKLGDYLHHFSAISFQSSWTEPNWPALRTEPNPNCKPDRIEPNRIQTFSGWFDSSLCRNWMLKEAHLNWPLSATALSRGIASGRWRFISDDCPRKDKQKSLKERKRGRKWWKAELSIFQDFINSFKGSKILFCIGVRHFVFFPTAVQYYKPREAMLDPVATSIYQRLVWILL